jgi:hypothetical protein
MQRSSQSQGNNAPDEDIHLAPGGLPQARLLSVPFHPQEQVRLDSHQLPRYAGSWFSSITEDQRLHLRFSGQRLLGLLLQYNSRLDDGEAFLAEACRLVQDYGQICSQAGMSITETVQAFLTFQRSILETIHATRSLNGPVDPDGTRLFQRTTHFFDTILLATVECYSRAESHSSCQPGDPHPPEDHPVQ